MSNFNVYLKMLRAWLTSGQNLTIADAIRFAVETVAGIAHLDLTSEFGQLVVTLLEGLILSKRSHVESGPITSPSAAIQAALIAAQNHGPVQGSPEQA